MNASELYHEALPLSVDLLWELEGMQASVQGVVQDILQAASNVRCCVLCCMLFVCCEPQIIPSRYPYTINISLQA
jgi:hypothetical protein